MKSRCRSYTGLIVIVMVGLGLAAVGVVPVLAFERYNDGCQSCHGSFTGGVSTKGTVFPGNDKHRMHRDAASMATQCNLCHTSGDGWNPYIGSSTGRPGIPGVGCNGCHGNDYGGATGVSGAGLRRHHTQAGVASCAACHPSDPVPLPEYARPPYYGTADTRVDDPCNLPPLYLENWSIGDTVGLDNDGDEVYDAAEPDCNLAGDMDDDGTIDLVDFAAFGDCWGGPSVPVPPAACTPQDFGRADIDDDNDVDFGDAALFQIAFTG